jgi:HAD superfamily hydrolase (TIGR01509 family)
VPGRRANLVIFDAFNTIVTAHPNFRGTFLDGLARVGLDPSPALLADLQVASEGIAHAQWSVSRASYQDWASKTLRLASRVQSHHLPTLASWIVPALEQLHQAPMVQMAGADACLAGVKALGYQIAVCSNWGWDLYYDLQPTGLTDYIDYFVPSAQAGYRKPHARIYETVLTTGAVRAENAVFVGDSIRADVLGPQRAGIRSILVTNSSAGSFTGERASSLAVVTELLNQ